MSTSYHIWLLLFCSWQLPSHLHMNESLLLHHLSQLLKSTAWLYCISGRCWAAIWLSCHPEPSGHAFQGEFEVLDIEGQHCQWFVPLHSQAAERVIPHSCKQEQKCPMLQSESLSGKCAKLHTVAASNNRDRAPQSLYYCLFMPLIYGCYSLCTSHS